jgi:glutathione peroxidase
VTTEPNLYALSAPSLDGKPTDLSQYKGKVALVVNVASECGYTPQYAGLEKLWKEYQGKGLVVLGFPSNEFGGQEPGDAAAIQSFCTKNFGVTFPLFAKVEVKKGAGQSPVYQYLTTAAGAEPNWNFCKYLVGKDGKVLKFWKSKTTPESDELRGAIDAALK